MSSLTRLLTSIGAGCLPLGMWLAGCGDGKANLEAQAPPPAKVEVQTDVSVVQVDHPEQFPVAKASESLQAPSLSVTGVVNPDVSRTVPVISLVTGRVVEIRARLGDTVQKGQVLLRVQSPDIASAFSDYRKAVADETLTGKQFERAQILYDKGAISMNDLQVAQDAEEKAKVDTETTLEHLRVLGVDKDHPSGVVDIKAPISGVITDQQVTTAAGVQGLSGSNPFTISDLSHVWVLCDVYENDLSNVRVGETAEIRLVAYPDKVLTGRISNIGPILHLHDRDWVYVPAGGKKFRRVEVKAGKTFPDKTQLILSGVEPGQEVVTNALMLQSTVEQ